METREKIKNFVINLEKKYPSLITNKMELGTKDHPNYEDYKWTENLVGRDQLMKWKKFKYILKVWEQVDNGSKPNWEINSLLRNYGYYHYDKLLKKERAKAEDIEINLERVRKQYTNSKHLQVDVNRLKKLGII